MTLDRLLAEIQARAERELAAAQAQFDAERTRLNREREERVAAIRADSQARAEAEAHRERAQRVAGARMQARKLGYEAQERAMAASLDNVRALLLGFTESDEYPEVLRRMYAVATDEFGKDVRLSGRAEDAALLKGIAGRGFDPTPQPILGGVIAETPDGQRRLRLSFDELLRLREDRVRALLA